LSERWPNLQDLIDADGTINIGEIAPISAAAVAMQGREVYAMLRIGDAESLVELLDRLDAAVGRALDGGVRTDEINR